MIDIGFYQLAQRRAEAVLPQLLAKALAVGHRVLVHSEDAAQRIRIDDALWRTPPESFLPHGIAATLSPQRAANQPILIDTALPPANAADCLAQVGGDLPDDLTGLSRVLFLFDADGTETARARWRLIAKRDDTRPAYWRETDDGRFEKAG